MSGGRRKILLVNWNYCWLKKITKIGENSCFLGDIFRNSSDFKEVVMNVLYNNHTCSFHPPPPFSLMHGTIQSCKFSNIIFSFPHKDNGLIPSILWHNTLHTRLLPVVVISNVYFTSQEHSYFYKNQHIFCFILLIFFFGFL